MLMVTENLNFLLVHKLLKSIKKRGSYGPK